MQWYQQKLKLCISIMNMEEEVKLQPAASFLVFGRNLIDWLVGPRGLIVVAATACAGFIAMNGNDDVDDGARVCVSAYVWMWAGRYFIICNVLAVLDTLHAC